MKLYFVLARRVPPVPSPVLREVFDRLRRDGFRVESGIPEETVTKPAEVKPRHDLYILKSHTELSLSLAGVLHTQGARLLHPYPNTHVTQNKIITARLLRAAGVPTPETWVTGDLALLRAECERRPLIIKPYLGHRGRGVRIVRRPEDLPGDLSPESPVVVQEYIEGNGEDLKLYVVGEEVFAVRKPFSPTSFTVPGRPCPVSPELRDVALRCGAAFGLGLYGIDMVERADGFWVVDLNTFPGYKGVPNVAPLISEYIAAYARGSVVLPTVAAGAAPPATSAPARRLPVEPRMAQR